MFLKDPFLPKPFCAFVILWKWLSEHFPSFLNIRDGQWVWQCMVAVEYWEGLRGTGGTGAAKSVGVDSPQDDGCWLCQESECPLPWVDLVHVVFAQQFFPNDLSGCFLSGLSVMGWVLFNRSSFLRDKMYFQLIASVLRFSLHSPTPWAVPLSGGQRYLWELSRKWYRE